ncbi:MAG TPA: plastocyanin/azurin family copper-binding protein [Nitrospirota bacterium]|nr:plastocyanin/azurin family copper-binding protein [Nitrospirota bacterium]
MLRTAARIISLLVIVIGFSNVAISAAADDKSLPPAGSSTVHEVHIPKGMDTFEPALLKIKTGETVKWINEDDRGHPIASIPGKGTNDKELFSSPIPPGGSWSHTFSKSGEYPYFCYIHYVMMGAVIVEDADQTSPEKTE